MWGIFSTSLEPYWLQSNQHDYRLNAVVVHVRQVIVVIGLNNENNVCE